MLIKKTRGFTLLEILIALFVFTILSLIMMNALHNVINVQSATDKNAARLRKLQMALLMFSRDVEQIVNRPTLDTAGKPDQAFRGTAKMMVFTHAGLAASPINLVRTSLQRTEYVVRDKAFWRGTMTALDPAPETKMMTRKLLDDVDDVHFQYLDAKNRFHDEWPILGQSNTQPLPRAVRIYITLPHWGSMSQFYVIPTQPGKQVSPPSES